MALSMTFEGRSGMKGEGKKRVMGRIGATELDGVVKVFERAVRELERGVRRKGGVLGDVLVEGEIVGVAVSAEIRCTCAS